MLILNYLKYQENRGLLIDYLKTLCVRCGNEIYLLLAFTEFLPFLQVYVAGRHI